MKPLDQLINLEESALPFVRESVEAEPGRCVLHLPSAIAGDVLHRCQVSTRSPLGAVAYHTGGISVLNGWLRILGSGSSQIPRSLADWNKDRSAGFFLIADDVFGGFFALNGGALGSGSGDVFYFAPRTLLWEPLECTYSKFFSWACSDFGGFYDNMIWQGCEAAVATLGPDRCFFFYPPLWSAELVLPPNEIRSVPVAEAWDFQMDMARQINENAQR